MKNLKCVKIVPPEGMEWYQEGDEIKFRPVEKKLTYEDIAKELFNNKGVWRLEYDTIKEYLKTSNWYYLNNSTSEKQAQKFLAINKLMNVAKYLNGDWQPNWSDSEESKYYFRWNHTSNELQVGEALVVYSDIVYFKSEKLAKQAIDILGEETIKLALSTDW